MSCVVYTCAERAPCKIPDREMCLDPKMLLPDCVCDLFESPACVIVCVCK